MPALKGTSIVELKILKWMQDEYPEDWVNIAGWQIQIARALSRKKLAETRETPRGGHQMRLTAKGREAPT